MIVDILKQLITEHIGKLKPASKGYMTRNCMLCHARGYGQDKRRRFGIKFEHNSIIAHCFNCGFSCSYVEGNDLLPPFKFLLKHLGADKTFIKHIEFEIYKLKNGLAIESESQSIEEKIRKLFSKWVTGELPIQSKTLLQYIDEGYNDADFLQVVEYAISRKIYDLDKFYWSPAKSFQLNNRLIIPYYYRDKVVGFTARLAFNLPDKSVPKYYQLSPEDFVYNLDAQNTWTRKYVIVTEGVLDAWAVDGVSTLGEINQYKCEIINRLQKVVIVCPDRDKKGGDLVSAAISNNWAVSFPGWDYNIKDAAQASEKYGRLLTTQSIIESAVFSKDKIRINWDIAQRERNKRTGKV